MDLRKRKLTFKAVIVIAAVIVAGLAIVFVITSDVISGIKKDNYQIVTLTTGERYIGKLTGISGKYATLNNVYYQQNTDTGEAVKEDDMSQTSITVAKLSSSVAKPENTLRISRDKIVYWANLQDDSKIVQAIKQDSSAQ